ncbi:hypothetical protein PP637_gp75 [Arthrobacter phage Persistence]|uniref:Uncharacterized protein n=1 Tax=Arthrobacter phage Persistence TaxID=2836007 RepID=A0A8F3IIC9_9CAUD|nr:hypothetical protein PP637_gp75 [Arthrobacter phage Persistence]QWY79703.1 hypothetical protein SEA_PERSISTENCE_75 [Arthrobacter phage Persistence]
MLKSEVAQLLAKAALIDNRKIDAATVEAWHEVIGHVDYDVAMAALTIHRRASSEYLMPAHIIANLRKARDMRAVEASRQRALDPPKPQPRTKMPEWFREALANFGKSPALDARDSDSKR